MRRWGKLGEQVPEERGPGATNLSCGRGFDALQRTLDEFGLMGGEQLAHLRRVGFGAEHVEYALEELASFPLPPNLRL